MTSRRNTISASGVDRIPPLPKPAKSNPGIRSRRSGTSHRPAVVPSRRLVNSSRGQAEQGGARHHGA